MPKKRYILQWIILSVLIILLGACKAHIGGTQGGGRYELKRSLTMPNYWEVVVEGEVRHVYNAVLSGIKDLGLNIQVSKVDSLSGVVEGSFSDKKRYNIKLSYESPGRTLMRINAGLTGEKNLSVHLFRAIEKHF